LFMHHLFCVLLHFVAFLCIFGTDLLTRCHTASSLISAIFVFQKSYTGNILRIGRNKSRSSYFSYMRWSPKQRWRGARGQPHHRMAQPAPGRATRWWGHLAHLLTPPFRLYILLDGKTLKDPINFPWNILQATTIIDARLGGSRSSSRHPAEEGNYHRRPSSSPCLSPEWCMSSLPWTTGP
jgi:hypothetical protein